MLLRLASSNSAKASHTICNHAVSFAFFTLIIPSSGYCVSTVGLYQHRHQFVQGRNVELRHRGDLLEPFPHGPARIEQFKTNIVVLGPSLQKYEHAKTAAFYRIHLGEVKHNGSGVALQGNNF